MEVNEQAAQRLRELGLGVRDGLQREIYNTGGPEDQQPARQCL